MDPRRTPSAQWADVWMGLHVGSDIALSNTMAREIIHAGLHHKAFIENATEGFDAYRASVEPYTLERGEELTGIPAEVIREAAHTYAKSDKAMICWTLGITEHHDAVDNVLALINLSLLTGHVGRWGCGCNPLRGQNNVQGGGDMGAIPNKLAGLPGDSRRLGSRAIRETLGREAAAESRMESHRDVARDGAEGTHLAVCDWRESGAVGRGRHHVEKALEGLDHLVVQEIFLTRTAELAHVVLPAAATWCEGEGTVTNSERRVQRCRKATEPPEGRARRTLDHLADREAPGHDWGTPTAEDVWNEFRAVAPEFAGGMSYKRLDEHDGLQWPCPDESHPGSHVPARAAVGSAARRNGGAVLRREARSTVEKADAEYPLILTTGRRLEPYNTGVQTSGYDSPLHWGESLDISPEDASRLGIADCAIVRITSRRGSIEAPAHVDSSLRAGMVFMTLHFPDDVATNVLTIDVSDPKSGTAEFKACAVRVEAARLKLAQ